MKNKYISFQHRRHGFIFAYCLNAGRIKHYAYAGTKGLGRQISSKLGLDHAGISMGPSYAAPYATDLGSTFFFTGAIYKGNALSMIELGFFLGIHIFNAKKRGVWRLVSLCSFKAKNAAFAVKSTPSSFKIDWEWMDGWMDIFKRWLTGLVESWRIYPSSFKLLLTAQRKVEFEAEHVWGQH